MGKKQNPPLTAWHRQLPWVILAAILVFSLLLWFFGLPRKIFFPLLSQPTAEVRPDQEPVLKEALEVKYPPAARRKGVHGLVILSLLVDEQGTVREAVVLSSAHPLLEQAALAEARKAVFVPAIKDGRAVSATVKLPVRFELKK